MCSSPPSGSQHLPPSQWIRPTGRPPCSSRGRPTPTTRWYAPGVDVGEHLLRRLHAVRHRVGRRLRGPAPDWYEADLAEFTRRHEQELGSRPDIVRFPCGDERTSTTEFDPHYAYQGAWVMQQLGVNRPARHVDVGSLTTYISFFATLQPTEFIDIRPANMTFPGVSSRAGSVLNLPFDDQTVESVSCLHVVEHVGLGRYGDPINPSGMIEAIRELSRVLAPGGHLYLSLPTGRDVVHFNAHRVTSPTVVLEAATPLVLVDLAAILDDGSYVSDASVEILTRQRYACGLYHFRRSE